LKKSIKINYLYNLSYQILILIVPLITTPYISRVLGAERVGDVSYVESVVAYFVLFGTPGVAILGQREVSYSQDNVEKRTKVFWDIKALEIITSTIALVCYCIFSSFRNDKSLYFAMTFTVLATVVDVSWFFQGMEEFGKIILRNFIIKLANVIYILSFIKSEEDTLKYVLGLTIFSFLANASLWGYLPKYVNKPKLNQLQPFKYLYAALLLFLPTIATRVYTVLDKTMIGVITKESAQNGYYEFAMRASKLVLSVVTAIGTVMIPRIGYHFNKGEDDVIEDLMYKSYRAVMLISVPLCLGLVFTADNFVPWFFGAGYDEVALLLKILAWLIIAIGLSTITGTQYMVPTQRQNWLTISVCAGALVNFSLNIFFISFYKSVGAAVASVIAEFTVTIVQFIMVRREIRFIKVLKNGIKYYIAGVLMSLVLYIEGNRLSSSIVNTMLMVLSGALVYGLILVLLKDSFVLELLIGIKRKITNRTKIVKR